MTNFILSPDALMWPTLWLSVGSLLALVALRGVRSPRVHRITCVVVLLQGWIWWRCECPVLPASGIAISNVESAGNSDLDDSAFRHELTHPVNEFDSRTNSSATDGIDAIATPTVEPTTVDLEMMEAAILAVDSSTGEAASSPTPVDIASPAPAADRVTAGVPIDGSRWLFGIWICGMLATVTLWGARYFVFQRHLPNIDELPVEFQSQWREVREQVGLSSSIPLWGLANLGPACGLMKRRCVVFVPTERWQTFTVEQRWAILLHEAAHLSRGDLWRSLLARLLALPQWFNPLAWRMVRRFDEAAEWACDEFVLHDQRACAPEFAEALLSLSVESGGRPQFSAAANGHPLSERVRRLLSPQPSEKTMIKRSLLVAALALCTIANFVRLSAQEGADANLANDTPQSLEAAPLADVVEFAVADNDVSFVATDDGVAETQGASSAGSAQASESPVFSFSVGFDEGRTPLNDAEPAVVDDFQVGSDPSPADTGTFNVPAAGIDFGMPPIGASGPGVTGAAPGVLSEYSQTQPGVPFGQPYGEDEYGVHRSEAVIDMSEVFKRSTFFQQRQAQLELRASEIDRAMEDAYSAAQEQPMPLSEGDTEDDLLRDLNRMRADIEAQSMASRNELRQAEVEMYFDTYRRIRSVIADYARENEIHTVRRVRNPVSDDDVSTDEILELINREIVYSADEPLDITEDIVERLNAIDAQANAPTPATRYMAPYYGPATPYDPVASPRGAEPIEVPSYDAPDFEAPPQNPVRNSLPPA